VLWLQFKTEKVEINSRMKQGLSKLNCCGIDCQENELFLNLIMLILQGKIV